MSYEQHFVVTDSTSCAKIQRVGYAGDPHVGAPDQLRRPDVRLSKWTTAYQISGNLGPGPTRPKTSTHTREKWSAGAPSASPSMWGRLQDKTIVSDYATLGPHARPKREGRRSIPIRSERVGGLEERACNNIGDLKPGHLLMRNIFHQAETKHLVSDLTFVQERRATSRLSLQYLSIRLCLPVRVPTPKAEDDLHISRFAKTFHPILKCVVGCAFHKQTYAIIVVPLLSTTLSSLLVAMTSHVFLVGKYGEQAAWERSYHLTGTVLFSGRQPAIVQGGALESIDIPADIADLINDGILIFPSDKGGANAEPFTAAVRVDWLDTLEAVISSLVYEKNVVVICASRVHGGNHAR